MTVLDLRGKQCPILLVSVKQFLMSVERCERVSKEVSLCFSSESSMQDIMRYFEKKSYIYRKKCEDEQFHLILDLSTVCHD